ncbi:hypothetical protein V1525DRAFT_390679 [Lipomyces kononenkoae]|uniref:Uncharacterized protein n=1 Tax=Lipomyces kononenkoae TaxID=34357 RepID=A0ACC3SVR1_LIPKO
MVGVAGKSQACNTCKRRRVKCDLRRPTCFRCEKANITCAGYERDHIFINCTPTQRSLTAASVIAEAKLEDSKQRLLPVYEEDVRSLIFQATNPSSCLPVEFRRNAAKLLRKIYCPEKHWHAMGSACAWLGYLDVLTEESQALDLAILAFCVVQTQLTKTSSFSLEEGLQFYSDALRHHRTDLQDEHKRSRDESLATITVLTTCELFANPIDLPWRVHALGIAEILRLRAQSGPQTRTWNRLSSRLRLVCILDSLTKEQPRFRSSGEWLAMSRNVYSQPVDRLLDIITNVPATFGQCNALMDGAHPEQQDNEMTSIIKELIGVVNQIHHWQNRTKFDGSRIPYWAVLSQIHNPADDKYPTKLFPFALEFDSLDSAIMFSFTWSACLQIFNKIIHIHRWFSSYAAYLPGLQETFGHVMQQDLQTTSTDESDYMDPNKISIYFIKAEADKLGRLLCQCVEYCFRTDVGTLGPQSFRYPQWTMRQFFRQNAGYERELEWALQIKYVSGPRLYDKLELMEFEDNPRPMSYITEKELIGHI